MEDLFLVSIAMATFNGEKFITKQLDSILNQTYKNFELIIVDDCSTDDTFSLLQKYEKIDKRIRLYRNDKNLGFIQNFAKCISLCNGEFISLSDQDDIWEEWKLQDSINHIKKFDLYCSDSLLIDENDNSLGYTLRQTLGLKKIPQKQESLFRHLCHANFVQGATILAKADFLKKQIKNLNKVGDLIFHDYYFALMASLSNGIYFTPKCGLKYRQHAQQVTINKKKPKFSQLKIQHSTRNEIQKTCSDKIKMLEYLLTLNLSESEQKYIRKTILYYSDLEKKSFFTVKYFIKNYYYIFLNENLLLLFLSSLKKICGSLLYKINSLKNSA